MELKLVAWSASLALSARLNRTFYGIETRTREGLRLRMKVLIVPFMELKPMGG